MAYLSPKPTYYSIFFNKNQLNMGQNTASDETYHHHKMIIISGKVLEITSILGSKLSTIKIEGFEDKMYFFTDTLKNENELLSTTVTMGMIDFFISKRFNEPDFERSRRGTLVFDVTSDYENQNSIMRIENYKVGTDRDRAGGTKACSPCKFMTSTNEMVEYTEGSYSYFPMVTFADKENPIGNCYFSFFKCLTNGKHALNDAKIDHVFGLEDNPVIDSDVNVFIHQDLT